MALHDLWHFENAPVGLNLSVAAYQTTYNPNTIYNQYTGLPGQPMTYGTSNTFYVTADGYLAMNGGSTGNVGALFVPPTSVQDWTNATQYWMGFRTKLIAGTPGASCHIVIFSSNTSYSSWSTMLDESHLAAAGFSNTTTGQVNGEVYIELFMDRLAMTFQAYANGILVNSGTMNTTVYSLTSFFSIGGSAGGSANFTRGFKDFYFLDVDATTPGRLGPIRAKASTTAAANGSEWVVNGASDLVTALNTPNQNPPVITPYVQAPVDNQSLALTMATSVSDSGNKILAVQPELSFQSSTSGPAKIAAAFKDASNNVANLGQFANGGGLQLNQRLPFQLKAPDGSAWSAAKINQSQFVLTPTN